MERKSFGSIACARAALLSSAVYLLSLTHPARAQTTPTPTRPIVDSNGVELSTGAIMTRSKTVSIGDLSFGNIWNGKVDESTYTSAVLDLSFYSIVFIDGRSILFSNEVDGSHKPELANGAILTNVSDGLRLYIAPDGTRYEFEYSAPTAGGLMSQVGANTSWFHIKRIIKANREIIDWNYKTETIGTNCGIFGICQSFNTYSRVQSITSNTGLMLKSEYASNTPGADFNRLIRVRAINRSIDNCDSLADSCAGLTQNWPTLSISISTDQSGVQQKLLSTLSGTYAARRRGQI